MERRQKTHPFVGEGGAVRAETAYNSRMKMSFTPLRCAAFAAVMLGCTIHVEQPRMTPRAMDFRSIDAQGMWFHVQFAAYNGNTFELTMRELNSHLFLEGNDVGSSVTNVGNVTLPPMREVPMEVDIHLPWNGVPAALMAMQQPMVNYTLQGDVTVEHYLSVHTDFTYQGTVPREFFMRGATGAINNAINSVLPGMGGVQFQ